MKLTTHQDGSVARHVMESDGKVVADLVTDLATGTGPEPTKDYIASRGGTKPLPGSNPCPPASSGTPLERFPKD